MPEIEGEIVRLRPMRDDDAGVLTELVKAPEVAKWWGAQDDDFPFDEPESTRFAIVADGRVAGLIQYGSEDDPDFRHASIDIYLDPRLHGRGLGTDAVRSLADHLHKQLGYHRVTIDPAVANVAAMRAYEKAGFRTVGVMEASWRDPDGVWQDSVLMERVVRLTSGQESP